MSARYVCVRKNYCMQKLWHVGEYLPGGVNLPDAAIRAGHFIKEGEKLPQADMKKPRVPGDDPRKTKEIIRLLKEVYGVEPRGKDKKTVWHQLRELEENNAPEKAEAPSEEKPKEKKEENWEDPKAPLIIADKTADEIDKITKAKLADALARQYGIKVNHTAHTKAQLLDRLIQAEASLGQGDEGSSIYAEK